MNKIPFTHKVPFTRLKIAQIERLSICELPGGQAILNYMKEHKEFLEIASGLMPVEFIIGSLVFTDMPLIAPNLPEETLITLKDLNKQFCSFDYLMII